MEQVFFSLLFAAVIASLCATGDAQNGTRVQCFRDRCLRGVQYCFEKEERCRNCVERRDECHSLSMPLQCDSFCLREKLNALNRSSIAQVETLTTQNEQLRAQNASLQNTVDSLNTSLIAKMNEVKKMEEEIGSLKRQKESAYIENKELQTAKQVWQAVAGCACGLFAFSITLIVLICWRCKKRPSLRKSVEQPEDSPNIQRSKEDSPGTVKHPIKEDSDDSGCSYSGTVASEEESATEQTPFVSAPDGSVSQLQESGRHLKETQEERTPTQRDGDIDLLRRKQTEKHQAANRVKDEQGPVLYPAHGGSDNDPARLTLNLGRSPADVMMKTETTQSKVQRGAGGSTVFKEQDSGRRVLPERLMTVAPTDGENTSTAELAPSAGMMHPLRHTLRKEV